MATMLKGSEITTAWEAAAGARAESLENHAYFEGDQPILYKNPGKKRKNGLDYHRTAANVFRVIARRHKGFAFGRPMNITLGKDMDDAALVEYEKVRRFNNLDKMDADHYLEALLSGASVEIHSFDGETPVITQTPAAEWAFVKDEFEVVIYAIRKITLPKSAWFDDRVLDSKLDLWTVYSATHIQRFTTGANPQSNEPQSGEEILDAIGGVGVLEDPVTRAGTENGYTGKISDPGSAGGGASGLVPFGDPVAHPYNRVPVFQWTGEEDYKPFFTQDFRTLQDAYNQTLSMLLDDVEGDIEALLLVLGFRQGQLSEEQKDEEGVGTGKTLIMEIKETGGISMDKDGDAKFIVRGLTHDKIQFTLGELRQLLYELGHAPDLSRVVGVTGQTTGIALKLQFQTMIEKTADSQHFVRGSIANRIDLLNRIWKSRKIELTGYNIEFTMLIPVNEIERWENIQFLMPLLSPVDLLKLIQSIDDPEQAWARKVASLAKGELVEPEPNEGENQNTQKEVA